MTRYIDYNKHTHDYINIQKIKKKQKKKVTKKVNSESLLKGFYLGEGQYTMWYRVPNKWSIDKKRVLIGIDRRL